MEVKRDIAIGIFEKMGYKIAGKWSSDRLARMIKRIPNLINEAVDYKLNDTESLWLDEVLGKIEDDKDVEFEIIGSEKVPDKEVPEEQKVPETSEEPAAEEPVTEAPATKKKTKKKATTKEAATKKATEDKKETIYDKAVVVIRQQKGEFTARKLVDDIVNTSDLKKSTASLVIQMAMSYGVAIGQLEKIRHGVYKPIT